MYNITTNAIHFATKVGITISSSIYLKAEVKRTSLHAVILMNGIGIIGVLLFTVPSKLQN